MTDEVQYPPPETPPTPSPGSDSLFRGFLLGVGMNILAVVASAALGPLMLVVLLGIGLVQLLYVVPLYLSWRRQWPLYCTGLAISAGLTFLLNASCWVALSQV